MFSTGIAFFVLLMGVLPPGAYETGFFERFVDATGGDASPHNIELLRVRPSLIAAAAFATIRYRSNRWPPAGLPLP